MLHGYSADIAYSKRSLSFSTLYSSFCHFVLLLLAPVLTVSKKTHCSISCTTVAVLSVPNAATFLDGYYLLLMDTSLHPSNTQVRMF